MSAIRSDAPRNSSIATIGGGQVQPATIASAQGNAEKNTSFSERLYDSVKKIPRVTKLPTEIALLIFTDIFSSFPLHKVLEIAEIEKIKDEEKGELWLYAWLYIRKELHYVFPNWFSTDKELKAFIKDAQKYGGKTFEQIFEGLALLKDPKTPGSMEAYQRAGIIKKAPLQDLPHLSADAFARNQLLKWLQENPNRMLACLLWLPAQTDTAILFSDAIDIKRKASQLPYPVHMLAHLPFILPETDIPYALTQAAENKDKNTFRRIFKLALSTPVAESADKTGEIYKKALEKAIENSNIEIVKYIFEQAIENAHTDTVKYVIDQFGINQLEKKVLHNSILHQLARTSSLDMVRLFVEHGAKLDTRNIEGKTPAEVVVSAISGRWFSPSSRVCRNDEYQRDINLLKVACYLIQQGFERKVHFDISCKPTDTTLLHAVCYLQPSKEIEQLTAFLVNKNPNFVDDQDLDGNTPLHIAIEEKHYKMMQFLLDYNAKLDAENNFGLTIMQRAYKIGDFKTLKILETKLPENLASVAPPIIISPIPTRENITNAPKKNTITQSTPGKMTFLSQVAHYMYTHFFAILTFIPLFFYEICRNWLSSIIDFFQKRSVSRDGNQR